MRLTDLLKQQEKNIPDDLFEFSNVNRKLSLFELDTCNAMQYNPLATEVINILKKGKK